MLFRNQPDPRREVAPRPKGVWICNGSNEGGGQHRTDAGTIIQSHTHFTGTVPGPDHPVKLQNLLLDPSQLSPECQETRTSNVRNSLVVWIGYDIEQFLNVIAADRSDNSKLGKMGAYRIDHRDLLTHKQMTRAMKHPAARGSWLVQTACWPW